MDSSGLPVERLRQYLRQLPSATRTLLIAELERAALRGDDIPGGERLLEEARNAARESGEGSPRIDPVARQFLRPLDAFLFDGNPAHKHQWHIVRSSLAPIWGWIGRELLPAESETFNERVSDALAAGR